MIRDILVAAAVAWIVSEATDISPWLAIRLVRWAADHMYPANAERAARRREEWEALIDKSIPTKTSKLLFGLGFGCAGLYCIVIRRVPLVLAPVGRRIRRIRKALPGAAETVGGWVMVMATVVSANLPGFWSLIVIGGMVALSSIVAGIAWVFTLSRATWKYRRSIFGPDERVASSTPGQPNR